MKRGLWTMGLVVAVSCGPASESGSAPPDLAGQFASLETRLLSAEQVDLDFRVTAEGAVEALIEGSLSLHSGAVRLTGTGEFAGRTIELELYGDGSEYTFGNADSRTTTVQPEHLGEALVIGFTRMGILHNLARLTGAAAPDHADGGVQEWVVVDAFRRDDPAAAPVTFDFAVEGEPSGTASLEIDSDGRPVERRQTVVFPGGEMRVVETYSNVRITPGVRAELAERAG